MYYRSWAELMNRREKRDWLERLAFFVPKSIREPWVGDLREDRAKMEAQGYSKISIDFATSIQLLMLLLACVKELALQIISFGLRRAG
jgi:hypothetical protein